MTPQELRAKAASALEEHRRVQKIIPGTVDEDFTDIIDTLTSLYIEAFEGLIGEDLDMKIAVRTHSDAGAGYTIGVNHFKDQLRKQLEGFRASSLEPNCSQETQPRKEGQ